MKLGGPSENGPSEAVDEAIPARAWLALLVSTMVIFLVVVNLSNVNVAFPSIRSDLGASDRALSWVVGVYNLTVGSFLLVAGRLADSMGRRRVYLPGVAIFGVGSVLCAIAPQVGWLIAGRVVQGVGGAISIAAGFAVMLPEFPSSRRSTPIGIAGAVGAFGGFVGPVLGSTLIDLFSWRAVFVVNVPICVAVLVLGPRFLAESRDPDATGIIDWPSVVMGTGGVALFMFAITQTSLWGLTDPRVVALAATALLLVVMLVRRSSRVEEPLIDLRLFEYRSFTSANLGIALYGLGFASGPLVSSVLLQDVWDLPVRDVGIVLAASPLVSICVSPIAGRLADRVGHRWILTVGCAVCATANIAYAVAFDDVARPWTLFVPLSLVWGLGVGLSIASWASAGISDVPETRFAIAGATFNTVRQAAYGLGIAVVVAIIAANGSVPTADGVRLAYAFIGGAFLLAMVAVALTFPAGSARDRSARPSVEMKG